LESRIHTLVISGFTTKTDEWIA